MSKTKRLSACVALLLAGAAMAQAPAAPDPAASDPVAMGWMEGSPAAAGETVRWVDGSFYKFPQTRWSFAHWNCSDSLVGIYNGEGQGRRAARPNARTSPA